MKVATFTCWSAPGAMALPVLVLLLLSTRETVVIATGVSLGSETADLEPLMIKEPRRLEYTGKNKGKLVASHLSDLLLKHDLTLSALANMIGGTKSPNNPLDSSSGNGMFVDIRSDPSSWKAEVVTPRGQGVDGQLVQAVLYSNEFRNPQNPQRVLSFAGVQIRDARNKEALPDGACLEASYSFKETQAEGTWQMICMRSGYRVPDMNEWATQIGDLVQSTNATFLTGFKQGCEIAKSEGLLNPNLPVVCWGATGTLTDAWIDAYPGLAKAIGKEGSEDEDHYDSGIIDGISVNHNTDISSSTQDGAMDSVIAVEETATVHEQKQQQQQHQDDDNGMLYLPQNHQIYVIQTFTDPSSNCLLPFERPGSGLANVCAYSAGSRCDPINGAPMFDYSIFSKCSDMASLPVLLESNLPQAFEENSCIPREDVGIDVSLKDCPFHHHNDDDGNNDNNEHTKEETFVDFSMGTTILERWQHCSLAMVSLLVTVIVLLFPS